MKNSEKNFYQGKQKIIVQIRVIQRINNFFLIIELFKLCLLFIHGRYHPILSHQQQLSPPSDNHKC